MGGLLHSAALVSLCGALSQALAFLTQVIVARQFGASADLDAFIAAFTVPQYVVAVCVTSLGLNFTPVFMDRRQKFGEEAAWRLASGVINTVTLSLLAITAAGLFANRLILRILAPGLSADALETAGTVAWILWPTVVLSGVIQFFTAIHQSSGRFGWPALVPILGATASLLLLLALAPTHGIVGLAIATTLGLGLQAFLLLHNTRGNRYDWRAGRRQAGVNEVLSLAIPLVGSALLSNAFPLLERHFASRLGDGAISHLSYGYRIVTAQMTLASAGLAIVLFPRFILESVSKRLEALRESLSESIRYLAVLVVPLTGWTVILARPLVQVAFERGHFNESDTEQVARLLQIYVLSLVPMALGSVTGRVLYAMRAMYVVATITVIEALLYWVSMALLSHYWGVRGIACATAIYLAVGLLMCIGYVHLRTPRQSWSRLGWSLLRTTVAATVSVFAAMELRSRFTSASVALLVSGTVALFVYGAMLRLLRSEELDFALLRLREATRRRPPSRSKDRSSPT